MKAIKNSPRYSAGVRLILYAVVSASFTVFFGGNWQDAVVSGILGMILMFLERLLESYDVNPFLSAFLFSLLGGSERFSRWSTVLRIPWIRSVSEISCCGFRESC